MTNTEFDEEILQESPVVDHYPIGIPRVMSDSLRTTMQEALDEGMDVLEVYDLIGDEHARLFRDDPEFRAQVYEFIERSGVNGICATLSAFGVEESHGWDAITRTARRFQTYIDSADWLSKALEPADLRSDNISLVFGIQDTTALEQDVSRLEVLYDIGIRIVQLTYSYRNLVGDGCAERTDAGLSYFGVEVLQKLNDMGMIVDLSHVGPATTADVLDLSETPPAFTHVFCRDLYDHPRGKTDEELERIADLNGYVGVVGVPFFLDQETGLDTLIDHVDHTVDIVGIDRVSVVTNWGIWTPDEPDELQEGFAEALGSRFGQDGRTDLKVDVGLSSMKSYEEWMEIPAALADRGYTSEEIQGLCGGNFVDYFERVV